MTNEGGGGGGGQGTATAAGAKPSSGSTGGGSDGGGGGGSSNSSSSSTSKEGSSGSDLVLPGISRNNIGIGFLPDYKNQKMSDITAGLGIETSFYGWYAQLPASGDWDGSQLLSQLDDLKACNCIFQPAVMPTKGWAGLTSSDNSQAKAIAAVMKKFTDEGIEVWLRFAHEVNYYVTDGTYQGTPDDFKAAWAVVAKAVADNDKVKMFFTPNVAASLDDYVKWYPDDPSTVDYLGCARPLLSFEQAHKLTLDLFPERPQCSIDYYPKSASESFVKHMQPLYDKYCKTGSTKFAIGETGTGWQAPIKDRLAWLAQTTAPETAKAMPHYVGVSWFNYDKEEDFRLWISGNNDVNSATKAWLSGDGVVASGAKAGNAR
ncbi:hypothetical protein JCM8202v2_006274 [Rhodotorula sphaerocarpa]